MELNEFRCRMCGACCRINPVKPDKCRTFPFEWTNPDSTSVCPVLAEGRRGSVVSRNVDNVKRTR
ncbi:MAG: hypothetical protein IKJ89_02475 [Kiritimatiellae bacterium]|nr:hypothetical protein [Kiritimatiellia bacterium]